MTPTVKGLYVRLRAVATAPRPAIWLLVILGIVAVAGFYFVPEVNYTEWALRSALPLILLLWLLGRKR